MANDAIKDGDIVQLKSGGPKMTVNGKGTTSGHVWCTWFDKEGKPQSGEFNPIALIKSQ